MTDTELLMAAYLKGKASVKITPSLALRSALHRFRKREKQEAATVEYKGEAYVLFLERIIKGE